MALLGEVSVNVTAQTQKFERGMKKSRTTLTRFQQTATTAKTKILGLKTAMAGVGAAIGIGAMVRGFTRIAEEIDEVTKVANRLGVDLNQLRGLQFAAEQTGASADTLRMGFQRMTRRIAQAAGGKGEAVEALEKLSLSAEKLNRLAPDQQFFKIAEALKAVGDRGDQIAIVQKLFDSEGVALLNTLDQGAAGLQTLIDQYTKMAGVITSDEAKKVEEFNDKLNELKKTLGGFAQGLVIDIAPAAAEAIEGLRILLEKTPDDKPGGKKEKTFALRTKLGPGGQSVDILDALADVMNRTAIRRGKAVQSRESPQERSDRLKRERNREITEEFERLNLEQAKRHQKRVRELEAERQQAEALRNMEKQAKKELEVEKEQAKSLKNIEKQKPQIVTEQVIPAA